MTDLQVKYQQTMNDKAKLEIERQKLEETKRSNLVNEGLKLQANQLQEYADISKYGNWYGNQDAVHKDLGYSIGRWIKDAGDMVSSWSPFSVKL